MQKEFFSYLVVPGKLVFLADLSLACSTGPEASRIGTLALVVGGHRITRDASLRSRCGTERTHTLLYLSTSDQARRPAEFKHINKRRKRNQPGFPE